MPTPASPQLRFLLRASGLLIVMLALWWWLLLAPILSALRISTGLLLHLVPGDGSTASAVLAENGDWLLRVPIAESLARLDAVQRTFGRAPGAPAVKVRSFRLAIASRVPTFFTLAFPLFWAIMLAGPRSRRLWKPILGGTALLAVSAQLGLLYYTGITIATSLQVSIPNLTGTLLSGLEYLNLNVIPYVAPLLLALWLHRELRAQIFFWGPLPEPVAVAPALGKKPGSRRRR